MLVQEANKFARQSLVKCFANKVTKHIAACRMCEEEEESSTIVEPSANSKYMYKIP